MKLAFGIRNSVFGIYRGGQLAIRGIEANFAWVQHFIHHLEPLTALRDSAFRQSEASLQVVSEAKDNMTDVDFFCLR